MEQLQGATVGNWTFEPKGMAPYRSIIIEGFAVGKTREGILEDLPPEGQELFSVDVFRWYQNSAMCHRAVDKRRNEYVEQCPMMDKRVRILMLARIVEESDSNREKLAALRAFRQEQVGPEDEQEAFLEALKDETLDEAEETATG